MGKYTILFLVLVFQNAFADQQLANQYSRTMSTLIMSIEMFRRVDRECKTQYAMERPLVNEIDFLLRNKTGYSMKDFESIVGSETIDRIATKHIMDLFRMSDGCDNSVLEFWYKTKISEFSTELDSLRKYDVLYGLPLVKRSDSDIEGHFKEKLKQYKELPIEEVEGLARALGSGGYWYSQFSLKENVERNYYKEAELWGYVIENRKDPKYYYYLANAQEKYDRKLALKSYEKSAEMGYMPGLEWMVTYSSCIKNDAKFSFWLKKAKENGYQHASIILKEIELFGESENCVDGWVD